MSNDDDQSKSLADFDQAAATMAESFPPLWRRLYVNLMAEGFSHADTMDLLKAYIMAMCGAAK